MRAILTTLVCIAASACTTVSPPLSNYNPIVKDIGFPDLGTEIEVKPGEDMVRHGRVTETRGLRLYNGTRAGGRTVSAGFYPRIGADRTYTYHSYRQTETRDDMGYVSQVRDASGKWAVPPDAIRAARATPELCLIFAGKGSIACTDYAGELRRVKRFILTDRDLNQKLTYLGRSNGTIRVRYWENSGHFARPESSNDLSFPAKIPFVIDHKGARIKVLHADAERIRFIVLKTFPSYWTAPRIDPKL